MAADRHPARQERSKAEIARRIVVLAVVAFGVAFAVLNLDRVDVNWVIGTWRTPLIVVIAVSLLVGAAAGYLVSRRGSAG